MAQCVDGVWILRSHVTLGRRGTHLEFLCLEGRGRILGTNPVVELSEQEGKHAHTHTGVPTHTCATTTHRARKLVFLFPSVAS